MKPRLDIAPSTPEDGHIATLVMCRQIARWRPSLDNWMKANVWNQDRRDADLMLRLTELAALPRSHWQEGFAAAHVLVAMDPEHFGWWGFAV